MTTDLPFTSTVLKVMAEALRQLGDKVRSEEFTHALRHEAGNLDELASTGWCRGEDADQARRQQG